MTPIDAARDLAPLIRKSAAENEAARRLSEDTVTAMREAGLFRILLPAVYGGFELPLVDALAVIEEVSAADGSAGWCLLKGAVSNQMAGYLPEATARSMWADPSIVTASRFAPTGRAVVVDGGYRLSGRWDWGTGAGHSEWLLVGAVVHDDDAGPARTTPSGLPEVVALAFPRSLATIHDTWQAAGMRATASNEFEVDAITVPADHTFAGLAAPPVVRTPNYAVPYIAQAMIPHAAVAVGLARSAVAEFSEVAAVKTSTTGGSGKLIDKDRVNEGVGRACALVDAARATTAAAVTAAWAEAAGGAASERALVTLSLAATLATDLCVQAVDIVHSLAGSTAVQEASPLQRAFRDIHVAASHALVRQDNYVVGGRALLASGG